MRLAEDVRTAQGRPQVDRGRRTLAACMAAAAVLGLAPGDARGARGPDERLVERLERTARGGVSLRVNKATDRVAFVRVGRNGDLLPGTSGRRPEIKAQSFVDEYGALFGARRGGDDLVEVASSADRFGGTHVTYQQVHRGVPVFGATVRVHVDRHGDLTAANGAAVPGLDVGTSPRLSAEAAATRAIAHVVRQPPGDDGGSPARGLDAADLEARSTTLYVYRTGLIRRVEGTDQLVYEVVVTDGAGVREFVYVHAHAGKVVNRFSAAHSALFRRLYEGSTANQVWQEGDAFPGLLNGDQQNVVAFSGDSYRLFANAFGRDSYDGAGAELRSITNDPLIRCPNAVWTGATTNYCNGVTSDDVVGHEWGHAYTEHTHGLIYQWQPGALNESYSDIWGEVVDVLNGAGTDAPAPLRSSGACSTHTRGLPELFIGSPASIAGRCGAAPAAFGPALDATGVTGDIVLADDNAGASRTDGCEPLTNGGEVAGRIALVDRGGCPFVRKVRLAQDAGAVAVVIANHVPDPPSPMGGVDPSITIPSVMIAKRHGDLIKGELAGVVNVTMRRGTETREDTYRWLLSEDSTAFGGAIRDMWNPNCLADPGKVTDAEYHCTTLDAGGVHTNSGVPNHGFALLVDGGTYNGRTVAPLGLTKAAHLYWRAQSVYQTPISDFDDHADALGASCADLVGVDLPGLSTRETPAGPSGESLSAADCASVDAMVAAVELRSDPEPYCGFQPLLSPNPPALCEGTKNPPLVFEEDFEDGLSGWTVSNQGVFAGWPGFDWTQDTSLPGGRAGTAAFAADPIIGDCSAGAGDVSGVMRFDSPAITLPSATTLSPRLTFEHYVATEPGWDGGNVRLSVNGGPYELVPASAYGFNRYNRTLEPVHAGNANPLAGEPAFSGTDGGKVTGSWGRSHVDLTKAGARPGDTVRLRFSFGMDGCNGNDGWYVDDVEVRVCNTKKARKED